jgi:threonine aldolase
VFAPLPAAIDQRLKAAGASYYPWTSDSMPSGLPVGADETVVRLVTSFQTKNEDVERFLAVLLG